MLRIASHCFALLRIASPVLRPPEVIKTTGRPLDRTWPAASLTVDNPPCEGTVRCSSFASAHWLQELSECVDWKELKRIEKNWKEFKRIQKDSEHSGASGFNFTVSWRHGDGPPRPTLKKVSASSMAKEAQGASSYLKIYVATGSPGTWALSVDQSGCQGLQIS